MFKRALFVAVSLMYLQVQASEPQEMEYKSKLSTSRIDFNTIINPEHKERIEVHMFWTTGCPYALLKDEYGADRTVDIGGAK